MKSAAVIVSLVLGAFCFAQPGPLPFVKNGKWSLVDTTGALLLTTEYSYIHTYDEAGLTFFREKGAYGIMDTKGSVLVPAAYGDIRQNGHGRYLLLTAAGWINYAASAANPLLRGDTLESVELLSGSWMLAGKKGDFALTNLASQRKWSLNDSTVNFRVLHDHVIFHLNDSTDLLLDPSGNGIFAGKFFVNQQNELYDIRQEKRHYVFDANGVWDIPGIESVTYTEEGVFIRQKEKGTLFGYDRTAILSGDYDDIRFLTDEYWAGYRNGFMTLVNRETQKRALPYKYEDIQPLPDGTYEIFLNGNTGIMDARFRELIPCSYTSFSREGDLVRVYDESFAGLFSLKTHSELLPPVYQSIRQTGNRFKAQRNELITLIELDDRHTIVKKAQIDNAITVSTNSYKRMVKRKAIDYRLFAIDWFLDSTLVTPPKGDPFYALKWGLKDVHDSILIPSSLSDIVYVPNAPFTMQRLDKKELPNARGQKVSVPQYRAVYLPKGKLLTGYNFVSYDSTDFLRRDFLRASTADGFGILGADGKWKPLAFLEKGTNHYISYCISENVGISETKRPDMTEVPVLNFTGQLIEHPFFRKEAHNFKKIEGFVYNGGRWNYFTPEGKPLFGTDFQFAQPFLGRQAIVMKGKAWGVTNPDTLIVPAVYSRIERKIVEKDTFFIAQRTQGGTRLLDTNMRTLAPQNIIASCGPALIVERGGLKYLCNASLEPLSDGYSSLRFLKSGFVQAKRRKELTLMNFEGTILFSGEGAPEDILFDEYPVLKKGASLTITDGALNPLLENCSSVKQEGSFVVVKRNGKWSVFNSSLKAVVENTAGKVLIDTLGGEIAVSDGRKVTVYAANGERKARLKGLSPTFFLAGRLIVEERDTCKLYAADGTLRAVYPALAEVEVLPNGAIFLKLKSHHRYLFTSSWRPILPEETKFRELAFLGEQVYAYTDQQGRTVLYNDATNERETAYKGYVGHYVNHRLLVKKPTGLLYIDEHFKALSKITYQQAIPYCGKYAAVGDQRGWTMIDYAGTPLGYPNFGPINALQPTLFETGKLALYGLFDTQGNNLIPVEYEQIRFLPNGIIQCVKEGELFYFRKDGRRLPVHW